MQRLFAQIAPSLTTATLYRIVPANNLYRLCIVYKYAFRDHVVGLWNKYNNSLMSLHLFKCTLQLLMNYEFIKSYTKFGT